MQFIEYKLEEKIRDFFLINKPSPKNARRLMSFLGAEDLGRYNYRLGKYIFGIGHSYMGLENEDKLVFIWNINEK